MSDLRDRIHEELTDRAAYGDTMDMDDLLEEFGHEATAMEIDTALCELNVLGRIDFTEVDGNTFYTARED